MSTKKILISVTALIGMQSAYLQITNASTQIETWSKTKTYAVPGIVVSHNGQQYCNHWWTAGDEPGTGGEWSVWKIADNSCPKPPLNPNPSTDPNKPVNPDNSGTASTTGNIPSLKEVKDNETKLTDFELFRNVKASIKTLDNAEVEKVKPGRQENPSNVKRVEHLLPSAKWNEFFPMRNKAYSYENMLKAIAKFPAVCSDYANDSKGRSSEADAICSRSLATMFAHFAQETGGHDSTISTPEWKQALVHLTEMGCSDTGTGCGYNVECNPTTWQGQTWPCGKNQDGSFKKYYGRGAKQLSYNYNYGPFSEAMFGNVRKLLDEPELVANTWLNLASAVFFFVTPQPPKPSMLHVIDGTWKPNAADLAAGIKPGFGATTMIINGGVECGGSTEIAQSQNRIKYFKEFANALNVKVPSDEVLGCAKMQQFGEQGAGALNIYWEQNWDWYPNNKDGSSFACKLVNYQTPFSALKETKNNENSNYVKCVEKNFKVNLK